jgi:hypothetical protein
MKKFKSCTMPEENDIAFVASVLEKSIHVVGRSRTVLQTSGDLRHPKIYLSNVGIEGGCGKAASHFRPLWMNASSEALAYFVLYN